MGFRLSVKNLVPGDNFWSAVYYLEDAYNVTSGPLTPSQSWDSPPLPQPLIDVYIFAAPTADMSGYDRYAILPGLREGWVYEFDFSAGILTPISWPNGDGGGGTGGASTVIPWVIGGLALGGLALAVSKKKRK